MIIWYTIPERLQIPKIGEITGNRWKQTKAIFIIEH